MRYFTNCLEIKGTHTRLYMCNCHKLPSFLDILLKANSIESQHFH